MKRIRKRIELSMYTFLLCFYVLKTVYYSIFAWHITLSLCCCTSVFRAAEDFAFSPKSYFYIAKYTIFSKLRATLDVLFSIFHPESLAALYLLKNLSQPLCSFATFEKCF